MQRASALARHNTAALLCREQLSSLSIKGPEADRSPPPTPTTDLADHKDKADIKWLTVKISNEIKSNKLFLGGISLLWLPVLIYGGIPDAVHLNYQRAMGMVSGINRQHW